MIGVRLTDRLGNNLFQYAAARGVAERRATGVALFGDTSQLSRFRLHPETVCMDPQVYGFSDDPTWCEAHLHLGAPTTWLPANEAAPERDLMLMAGCHHHVIANSSFSWWGAWLGQQPGQIVIAPRRWFDGYVRDTADLVPTRWTTVRNPPTLDRVGAERVVRRVLRPLGLIDHEGNLRRDRFRRVRS